MPELLHFLLHGLPNLPFLHVSAEFANLRRRCGTPTSRERHDAIGNIMRDGQHVPLTLLHLLVAAIILD